MLSFTVAGQRFELDRSGVEAVAKSELPDPIGDHYVVVGGRRFPPKQVLAQVTGLDRADFTTHHARRILKRLGFVAGRASHVPRHEPPERSGLPHGGRQAAALEPFRGKWVALGEPTEVLVAADTPEEVIRWLARHERKATGGMLRVPTEQWQTEGILEY